MKEKLFFRNCPNCFKKIGYTLEQEFKKAVNNNSFCSKCCYLKRGMKEKLFFRNCPNCGEQLGYTNIKNRNHSEKTNKFCRKCRSKEVNNREESIKSKSEFAKKHYSGKGNPFYGKHHTKKTKQKMKEAEKCYDYVKSKKYKDKMSEVTSGKNNGMYGRTFYDIWVEKYGKEYADKKLIEYKKKQSINFSGKNNPMYGKPSPMGSGNGWGGWYKGWYFRSLRELSYMIQVIEKNNYKWSSAEKKKFCIKYKDYNGSSKTYRPDFFVNDNLLIEIKPKELMNTPNNILKKNAAIKFCKKNGYEYRVVDIKILKTEQIIKLYELCKIRFIDKYDLRMKSIIDKNRL